MEEKYSIRVNGMTGTILVREASSLPIVIFGGHQADSNSWSGEDILAAAEQAHAAYETARQAKIDREQAVVAAQQLAHAKARGLIPQVEA